MTLMSRHTWFSQPGHENRLCHNWKECCLSASLPGTPSLPNKMTGVVLNPQAFSSLRILPVHYQKLHIWKRSVFQSCLSHPRSSEPWLGIYREPTVILYLPFGILWTAETVRCTLHFLEKPSKRGTHLITSQVLCKCYRTQKEADSLEVISLASHPSQFSRLLHKAIHSLIYLHNASSKNITSSHHCTVSKKNTCTII